VGALKRLPFWRNPIWISAVFLYALNRWALKPALPWEFLHSHFNDCLLIPAALPPVLFLQECLGLRLFRGSPRLFEVISHLVVWSLLFEAIGPFVMPVTGDVRDVACYSAGAVAAAWFWFLQRTTGFDRLAPFYTALDCLASGTTLQRARVSHLEALRDCREILIAGEGTGRFLQAALAACPGARFTCVENSSGMLECITRCLERMPADANRVRLLRLALPDLPQDPLRYDAIVTPFFLDCYEGRALREILKALAGIARPNAFWLVTDYAPPARGWRGWRSRFWLAVLYAFFRHTTGLQTRRLEDPSPLLRQAGFQLLREHAFSNGLLRSRCWHTLHPS
jgi:hypothetical protein